ncbi:MAG TPA: MBL fold metallo-hydrolase [Nitrososphaeraceae archaeon]|nr:MBL fold metallo-hydrolase [Nitrososphaeraceae archaeon]
MRVIQIPVGQMANFTYILVDITTRECILIDPSWDLEKIFDFLRENSSKIKYIINTHGHFDHILGNAEVANRTGAKIVQHKSSKDDKDISVAEGDSLTLGKNIIKVLHTPGHSKDSMCLIVNDQYIFTGDTLFVGNCGRVDLPGSDPNEMYDSLYNKILHLSESLVVYPGHDYGELQKSTIGREKKANYVLQHSSKEDFLSFMKSDG